MTFRAVDIDSVPVGTMVYSVPNVPLGVVRIHESYNPKVKDRRVIDTGRWADRFLYRRQDIYRTAKRSGKVFVKEDK